jgi:Protein of unknown function (DUF3551)
MCRLLISLGLVSSALLGTPATSSAEDAISKYPWCWEGPRSCYYTTWEQCHREVLGRGGFCIQSPYYRPQSAVRSRSQGTTDAVRPL